MSPKLRATLVVSLIFSLVDHCRLVYNDLTAELNNKLQKLINCGIRFIFDLRHNVHISPYRRRLDWLYVRSKRLYFLGITVYNILQDRALAYLLYLFVHPVPSQQPSRQVLSDVFMITNYPASCYQNSFYFAYHILLALSFGHSCLTRKYGCA